MAGPEDGFAGANQDTSLDGDDAGLTGRFGSGVAPGMVPGTGGGGAAGGTGGTRARAVFGSLSTGVSWAGAEAAARSGGGGGTAGAAGVTGGAGTGAGGGTGGGVAAAGGTAGGGTGSGSYRCGAVGTLARPACTVGLTGCSFGASGPVGAARLGGAAGAAGLGGLGGLGGAAHGLPAGRGAVASPGPSAESDNRDNCGGSVGSDSRSGVASGPCCESGNPTGPSLSPSVGSRSH